MALQLLTRLLFVLLVTTGSQVSANWSLTFYETFDQCTGEDTQRNHYYVFSGDPSLWEGNPFLRSECFTPCGDRIQEGIDTNMICAETFDGGATMQECGPSIIFKLKDWSWSVSPGSDCTWGPLRPYVNPEGVCQAFRSEPAEESTCYDGAHEMHVQAHDFMNMMFACACGGDGVDSDTCKPSYLDKREKDTAAADVKEKNHIWTECTLM